MTSSNFSDQKYRVFWEKRCSWCRCTWRTSGTGETSTYRPHDDNEWTERNRYSSRRAKKNRFKNANQPWPWPSVSYAENSNPTRSVCLLIFFVSRRRSRRRRHSKQYGKGGSTWDRSEFLKIEITSKRVCFLGISVWTVLFTRPSLSDVSGTPWWRRVRARTARIVTTSFSTVGGDGDAENRGTPRGVWRRTCTWRDGNFAPPCRRRIRERFVTVITSAPPCRS